MGVGVSAKLSSLLTYLPNHLSTGVNEMADHLITGYYVAIPQTTLESKEWKALTPSTRCVYHTMLKKYIRKGEGANGRVTWAQVELAEASGLSLRTIGRSTDDLLDKEWLWIDEPGGRWAKGTTYEMNPKYADGQTPKATKK